jgi:hypothetical protein
MHPQTIWANHDISPFTFMIAFGVSFTARRPPPPPMERFRFIIQNLGSRLFFVLAKLQTFDHDKHDNLTFCDKMAMSQEREVGLKM